MGIESYYKFKVKIDTIKYPRNRDILPMGTWGICNCIIENDETDYTKVNLEKYSNGDFFKRYITITGELPEINIRKNFSTYSLVCEKVIDKKYGEQFKIIFMESSLKIENKNDCRTFLECFLTTNQVNSLFNTLADPIKVIKEKDFNAICKVKGIKEATAKIIFNKYEENILYQQAFSSLCEYGISLSIIKKVVDTYKNVNKALEIIKNNPYKLANDISGIGWIKADEIGIKMGFTRECVERIQAYVQYFLNNEAQSGRSWVEYNTLIVEVLNMYDKNINYETKQIIANNLKSAFNNLKNDNILSYDSENNRLYLTKYYEMEKEIVQRIKHLIESESNIKTKYNVENVIKEIEDNNGWKFTAEQIQAVNTCLENNVSIITGFAGTGKSTTLKIILDCLKDYYITICSLAGKAAARTYEITGYESSTIHRLLGFNPRTKFVYNEFNKLSQEVIVIDELGLCPEDLFLSLLKAIKKGTKLIMVGDTAQLTTLGVGNLLKDFIESKYISTTHLTEPQRTSLNSAIITESFKVKNGEQLSLSTFYGSEIRGKNKDFELNILRNEDNLVNTIMDKYKECYNKCLNIKLVQGIVPLNSRGDICVNKLNLLAQEFYNPQIFTNEQYTRLKDTKFGTKYSFQTSINGIPFDFRLNDRVMNIVNNYDITKIDGDICNVFNGYIGTIIEINDNYILIDFDIIGKVCFPKENVSNLVLAYFSNTWKLQGSENEYIIIGFDMSAYTLLSREFLYTSITRAKKYCCLITNSASLKFTIDKKELANKKTFINDIFSKVNELPNIETNEYGEENSSVIESKYKVDI